MLFKSKAKEDFKIEPITSQIMDNMIERCAKIYAGRPEWLKPEDHIKTINFAKAVCSETARLATLAIGISISGSARADWLQAQIDKVYFQLRNWVEYGLAYGTIILKPNGETIDIYTPDKFIVTAQQNGDITGVVFMNSETLQQKHYTRLEYHRFIDGGLYQITNKCYVGDSVNDLSKPVDIGKTPWADLLEDATIQNVDGPLYGVLRTPCANNIDIDSPLGLPIFADAIEEFKDLDIAYSRNVKEIYDSKRMVLLDSDRLFPDGGVPVKGTTDKSLKAKRDDLGLPDYVKNVYGDGKEKFYQEINPEIQTESRLAGINALLSQIGYKCGFSNGYFVFNETSGIQTATGVEAEQQRTIQFIKDVRDKVEKCLDDTIYALNVFADLYEYAPVGAYEVVYDFGDPTYNLDEDRARWHGYTTEGNIPFWYYLMKFEGFTEEDAKALVESAQQKEPTLFGREE